LARLAGLSANQNLVVAFDRLAFQRGVQKVWVARIQARGCESNEQAVLCRCAIERQPID
jgi:hypothetical protein